MGQYPSRPLELAEEFPQHTSRDYFHEDSSESSSESSTHYECITNDHIRKMRFPFPQGNSLKMIGKVSTIRDDDGVWYGYDIVPKPTGCCTPQMIDERMMNVTMLWVQFRVCRRLTADDFINIANILNANPHVEELYIVNHGGDTLKAMKGHDLKHLSYGFFQDRDMTIYVYFLCWPSIVNSPKSWLSAR